MNPASVPNEPQNSQAHKRASSLNKKSLFLLDQNRQGWGKYHDSTLDKAFKNFKI